MMVKYAIRVVPDGSDETVRGKWLRVVTAGEIPASAPWAIVQTIFSHDIPPGWKIVEWKKPMTILNRRLKR